MPGIDEAIAFSELMNSVDKLEYDLLIFDTAPTGHTLKFLNFPELFDKALEKILSLKEKLSKALT